jgi:integrase
LAALSSVLHYAKQRGWLAAVPPIARFALATGLRESNIEADEMKAGRAHSAPLNADALRVLAAQRGKHHTWVIPVPRWLPKEHPEDKPQQVADEPTGKTSNHAWRKACVRAGVPTLRFHDLRHTWASWHMQAGTPLPVFQALGGWASPAMVMRSTPTRTPTACFVSCRSTPPTALTTRSLSGSPSTPAHGRKPGTTAPLSTKCGASPPA